MGTRSGLEVVVRIALKFRSCFNQAQVIFFF